LPSNTCYNIIVTKDKPTLLLLDNHQSRLAIRVLDLAKKFSGVIVFPTSYQSETETLAQVYLWPIREVCEQRPCCVVKKTYWQTMIIYIPSIMSPSLPNALTSNNIKSRFFPSNTDMFTDEGFSPSAVTDFPLDDNKNLENSGLSDSHTSTSNLDVSSQLSSPHVIHSSSEWCTPCKPC
jgi:hypothetical protein